MLKVSLHFGALDDRCFANQLAALDIAYAKRAPLADYLVALSLRGSGEMAPATVTHYPRWSASLWDLVARALTQLLYRTDQAPPSGRDRRCAYATRLSAVIERSSSKDRGVQLATMELRQAGRRGHYRAVFEEDIHGARSGEFDYGHKVLNPPDLLLRAICWTYFGTDILGPKPSLILPAALHIDGDDRFHIQALAEPARTGFRRYLSGRKETDELPRAEDYVRFLTRG